MNTQHNKAIKPLVPPIVLSWYSWNCPLTKRRTRLDLPTADSPRSTTLNWHTRPCTVPFGRIWAAMLHTLDWCQRPVLTSQQICYWQTTFFTQWQMQQYHCNNRVYYHDKRVTFRHHHRVSYGLFNGSGTCSVQEVLPMTNTSGSMLDFRQNWWPTKADQLKLTSVRFR